MATFRETNFLLFCKSLAVTQQEKEVWRGIGGLSRTQFCPPMVFGMNQSDIYARCFCSNTGVKTRKHFSYMQTARLPTLRA